MKHFTLLTGVLATLSSSYAPAADPRVLPTTDSWDRILGFLDFDLPDTTEAEILANGSNYAFVFSGMSWHGPSFAAVNPNIRFSRYIPGFQDDHNARPDPVPENPGQDTPERRARTLLWWNTEVDGTGHPDWVLYTCDRLTPAYWYWGDTSAPNMPLDISNPDVASWQLRNAGFAIGYLDADYSSLSADLVYVRNYDRACGIYRNGQWVQLFSGEEDDPAFSSAVINWASRIHRGLQSLPLPRAFVANFSPFPWYSDEEIASVAASLDGMLDEQGFTGYASGRIHVAQEAWLHRIRNMIAVQAQGAAFYSMNYVLNFPPPQEELEWILGSFLMGKEHSAYLLVTPLVRVPGSEVRWPHLPQYDEDMGHPCAAMASTQGVYVRDYSRGISVVNPSWSSSYTFTLPGGSFRDLLGNPIEGDSLYLPPLTGKVLLSSQDRCP